MIRERRAGKARALRGTTPNTRPALEHFHAPADTSQNESIE